MNINRFLLSALLAIMTLFQTASLSAGGWGKTDFVTQFQDTTWNGVYFDMNGLYFTASIPNYSGTLMQNGGVSLNGKINKDTAYIISTSMNPGFTPSKTLNDFVKMIQDANPDYVVIACDSGKLGAKYAIDMVPLSQNTKAFWRFLCTKDRLIKMGTDDANQERRLNFFESIYIH